MVRRVVIPAYGDVNVLALRETDPPPLSPGSIRIRVVAAGVNFADLLMRMGLYPEAPRRPFTPGYEVSGTILELSPEAAAAKPDLSVGTRVLAVTRFGGYAEEVVVPAATVFPLPPTWSFEEGAAFPVVFLTAWMGLCRMARVRAGDRVLITSVAGGVGLAALQIARAAGARVMGTASGEEKVKAALERGAEVVSDPTRASLAAAVRGWAPEGLDVVLESRGWRGVRESLGYLAPGGRIISFGVSEMAPGTKRSLVRAVGSLLYLPTLNVLSLMRRNAGIFGLNLLTLWDRADLLDEDLGELLAGAVDGRYRPEVWATFPLAEASRAHAALHERRNIGKAVLLMGTPETIARTPAVEVGETEGTGPAGNPAETEETVDAQMTFDDMGAPRASETLVVIGAGTMGHGIAQVAAQAGLETILVDVHPGALERGLAAIRKNLEQGVEKGKVTSEDRDAALAHLRGGLEVESAIRGASVIVEAVPEDLALKKSLFTKIDAHAPESALLATNTSSLPVGEIAAEIRRPDRMVGMHFFNPVHLMPLLELIRARQTSEETVARALALGARLGKECIVVQDSPGFATSRLGVVLGLEAMRMLEAGVASAEDIDKAMTLGYRHPVGPLRLTDLVGLDVRLAIAEHLHLALGSDAFRPPEILRALVAEGKLGKKTGQGFYAWAAG